MQSEAKFYCPYCGGEMEKRRICGVGPVVVNGLYWTTKAKPGLFERPETIIPGSRWGNPVWPWAYRCRRCNLFKLTGERG